MSKKSHFIGLAAAVSMSLGYTGVAQAASVTTSGIWASANSTGSVSGVNTNQISWGTPYNASNLQSSYVFQGVSSDVLPLDGSSFLLGTFTHNNFTITGNTITGANLQLDLNIGGSFTRSVNLFFNHNETPNNGNGFGYCPSTPGYGTPCPDVVSIPSAQAEETININNLAYKLEITGFQSGGQLVSQFITTEAQANSAQLYARLVRYPVEDTPEPVTILGTATALGLGGVLKRKQAQAKKEKVTV